MGDDRIHSTVAFHAGQAGLNGSLMSPCLALVPLAYLVGSIPFGVLVARRFAGLDVRGLGSGNIGATNVARVAGKKLGLLVLVLDALKGLLPTLAARLLVPEQPLLQVATGAAAILGHIFPLYLKLKGGKGVATTLGVFVVLLPWPVAAGVVVFAGSFAATRVVAVGSVLSALTVAGAAFWLYGPSPFSFLAGAAAVLILWRHRSNLRRLLRRAENRL